MLVPKYSVHAILVSLLAFSTILVHCTPILNRPFYFLLLGFITVLFALFRFDRPILRKSRKLLFLMFFYVFLTAFYRIVGKSDGHWGNSMHEYSFLISFVVFLLIIDGLTRNQIKYLFWLMVIVIAFNVIDNIYLYYLYPQLAGEQYYMDEEFLSSINAGGTSFYTFCLFVFNIFFFVLLNTGNKQLKYIMIFLCIIITVYIFGFCGKGSIVVYTLLSIPLQIFASKTNRSTTFIFVAGTLSLFALLLINIFKETIVDWIISVFPVERVTIRLVTLIDSDNMYANDATVTNRTTLYLLSLQTWVSNLENFLFGIGDIRVDIGAAATGIGQHSEFFDSLARYGLVGGIIIYSLLKSIFKYIISFYDVKYFLQLLVILGIIVLCGCTKKLFTPNIGAALFIIFPLLSFICKRKNN